MKFKGIFSLCALAAFFLCGTRPASADPKPVMVHYMPWFQAKGAYSSNWGFHWTMNHYNPNIVDPNGRREVASWYYPLIGAYDSLDPAVLEYHVVLMKLGGIDGVIVDWYGSDNYVDYGINNQRTVALFNYIRKAGLKFSLCYEDQTIPTEINGGFITASNAITHAQQVLLYAQSNFFSDASFLQLAGKPVLLNFGPQYFKTNAAWVSIFSALSNQPAFFTEDSRYQAGQGAFNWPPMWASGGGTLTTNQLNTYLTNFESSAKTWPAYVSSAFPRFHDIYQQAGVGASYGYLDDANGAIFQQTLRRAFTNSSSVIQVVTWNDYGEGTVVEPNLDYGFRDLGVIQDMRRQYLDSNFPYHTNDLAIALQLYNLRNQYKSIPAISAELDRVFTNIVFGKSSVANVQLNGLASTNPVIYNLTSTNTGFQFCVGGYVASPVQVQMCTNLNEGAWQTVRTYAPGTNLILFSTNFIQGMSSFFRVQ